MSKVLKFTLLFLCFSSSLCQSSDADEPPTKYSLTLISLVVEDASNGLLVYIHNATSGEAKIKNTLNLRGKGSSLSPVSLYVENEAGNRQSEVMVVDPADESTCLLLKRNAVHGIIYQYSFIKEMFHLAPGQYRVKAIYEDYFCNESAAVKMESNWIEISIN